MPGDPVTIENAPMNALRCERLYASSRWKRYNTIQMKTNMKQHIQIYMYIQIKMFIEIQIHTHIKIRIKLKIDCKWKYNNRRVSRLFGVKSEYKYILRGMHCLLFEGII